RARPCRSSSRWDRRRSRSARAGRTLQRRPRAWRGPRRFPSVHVWSWASSPDGWPWLDASFEAFFNLFEKELRFLLLAAVLGGRLGERLRIALQDVLEELAIELLVLRLDRVVVRHEDARREVIGVLLERDLEVVLRLAEIAAAHRGSAPVEDAEI